MGIRQRSKEATTYLLSVKEEDLPKGKPKKETSKDMVDLERNKDDCILFLTRNNQPICFPCL